MTCFNKGITRHALRVALILVALSLLLAGTATAAAKYRDDIPVPFSQIVWDHPNISGWPITSDLHEVSVSGGTLYTPHTKACAWPLADRVVNANIWVMHKARDGRWHANTWDFMRQCQVTKIASHVGAPDGWRPRAGEEVYFFISGIARPGYEYMMNVAERTNVVKYYWGQAAGKALPALPPCTVAPVIESFAASLSAIRPGGETELNWEVTGADGLILEADNGNSASLSAYDPFVNGVEVSPEEHTTYTLRAVNQCVDNPEDPDSYPSSQLRVNVVSGLPFVKALLLRADQELAPEGE